MYILGTTNLVKECVQVCAMRGGDAPFVSVKYWHQILERSTRLNGLVNVTIISFFATND